MRIFITGANGFIGRHLVPLLDKHQLLAIGREQANFSGRNISYIRANLADPASWEDRLEEFAPEACIHLAWQGLPDYSFEACLKNFDMSARLFDLLTLKGCKTIFVAGTGWEYGDAQGAVKEEDSPGKMSLFASFKTALRLVGENLAAQRKVNFIWGRLFFVYGPGQRDTSLMPSCYRSFVKGECPAVKNPDAVCDFVHVADAASAIKALIETKNTNGTFNIGSGSAAKVSQVCDYVAQALKAANSLPDKKDSSDKSNGFWADISLINGKTGWKPQTSLRKGVEEMMRELGRK